MERPGDAQEVQLLKGQRSRQPLRHFSPVTPPALCPLLLQRLLRPGGSFGESPWAAQGLGRSCELMESPDLGMWGCCLYHCCSSWLLHSSPEPLGWCLWVGSASVSSSLVGLGPLLSLGQSQHSGAGGHQGRPWAAMGGWRLTSILSPSQTLLWAWQDLRGQCCPLQGLYLRRGAGSWTMELLSPAYNIHVNGVLHCRVRYSQLLGLHEQLRKEYGTNVVPAFPPKKIFTLTPAEVEQRREQLEKYMQAVRQDPMLGGSETFNSFLRKAQQETQQIPTEEVVLEVLLSNGQKVKVTILTSDQTEDVLEAVASKLDLPDDLVGYFSLFLVRQTKDGAFSFVRKLQEFELPYVSVTSLHNPEFQIILRKSYWDSAYDDDVMEHRVGLNLLYAQTVSDIEHGWILVNKEQHRQLKSLQEKVSKKEFIRLAQTLKYYGYLKFDPCVTDFPEKGCHVVVSAGNNELNFQVRLPNEQIKEGSFKVTRMRCWRVTSSVPMSNGPSGSSPGKSEVKLELAFEYLMSKDRLQWVTITSPQAIMLSICLQSMVDELMVKKSGGSIRKMFRRRVNGALRRSDSQQAVKSPPLLDSPDASWEPMAKLSSKLTSVSLRGISHSSSANDVGANDFHGNYAFEGIGDEDL
ncbi:sorting nexin-17 isoform X1 [Parus major]|nr:sorting nexin-17 isoform X1 [Parus major]